MADLDITVTPTLTAHPEYAYSPRQGARSNAHYHAVLDQDLTTPRLKRKRGATLCPASFWGLEPLGTSPVTCPRCLSLAERYGVTLIDPTAPEWIGR